MSLLRPGDLGLSEEKDFKAELKRLIELVYDFIDAKIEVALEKHLDDYSHKESSFSESESQ